MFSLGYACLFPLTTVLTFYPCLPLYTAATMAQTPERNILVNSLRRTATYQRVAAIIEWCHPLLFQAQAPVEAHVYHDMWSKTIFAMQICSDPCIPGLYLGNVRTWNLGRWFYRFIRCLIQVLLANNKLDKLSLLVGDSLDS